MSDDLTELERDLATAGPIMTATAATLIERTMQNVAGDAAQLVPVLSGDLQDSILAGGGASPLEGVLLAKFYGYFVEYGTAHSGPRPWFNPPTDKYVDEFAGQIVSVFEKSVGDE